MLRRIWDFFVLKVFGKINWNFIYAFFGESYYKLTSHESDLIFEELSNNHFLILTRRKTHLTTYLIGLSDLFLRGKWGYWTHGAMNIEGDISFRLDVKIVEAIGEGVKISEFKDVFDCDSVCLLVPKGFSADDWSKALAVACNQIGKDYDTLFDVNDPNTLSCVELVRVALMGVPDYFERYACFEKMIKEEKNLTPQMLYDCPDFEIWLEIRH